jgi:hypothetical protein
MAAAVKPGGWLLIQEPDFHLAPTTEPEVWAASWSALIECGRADGVDWLIGRKLPSMVSKLGLGRPQAKTDVQTICGRGLRGAVFQAFFAEVRDRGWTVDGSTRLRWMLLQGCWTIRTIGPSAG